MPRIIIIALTLIIFSCNKKANTAVFGVYKPPLNESSNIRDISLKSIHIEEGECKLVSDPEKEFYCIDKENAANIIYNTKVLRIKYNELKQKLVIYDQYYGK